LIKRLSSEKTEILTISDDEDDEKNNNDSYPNQNSAIERLENAIENQRRSHQVFDRDRGQKHEHNPARILLCSFSFYFVINLF